MTVSALPNGASRAVPSGDAIHVARKHGDGQSAEELGRGQLGSELLERMIRESVEEPRDRPGQYELRVAEARSVKLSPFRVKQ